MVWEDGVILSSPDQVAESLDRALAQHSHSSNYHHTFRTIRDRTSTKPEIFLPVSDETYNRDFTVEEFQAALSSCKDGVVGPDGIHYQIIRNLHPTAPSLQEDSAA